MMSPAPSTSINEPPNPSMNGIAPVPSPPAAASTIPIPETAKTAISPPTRSSSPRLAYKQLKKNKKLNSNGSIPLPAGLLDGTVPPINVLIVEDNSINLKLLEAFMKRLKVRWQTAMNGREAVNKWRQGGFHLVLMDIQLPVMNGLDATIEIRRLERLNGIGVFSRTVSGRRSPVASVEGVVGESEENTPQPEDDEPLKPEDTLENKSLFRSPVIIVALTASSLQSDRHEALAAGCNDFLTKPVNIVWLEQKVTEWGCMQALIDFEGWRKWRGFVNAQAARSPTSAQAVRVSDPSPEAGLQSGGGARRLTLSSKSTDSYEKDSPAAARGGVKATFGYPSAGSGKASSASSSTTVIHNGGTGRNMSSGGNTSAAAKKVTRGNPALPSPKTATSASLEF